MPVMSPQILVAEDDRKVRTLIAWRLEADGHEVQAVADGAAAIEALDRAGTDLVVLDLNMPGIGGLDVLARIRQHGPTPVIVVSARTGETDRIVGLDLGADDYLVKPFSPDELAARVRSLLRRAGAAATAICTGSLEIDLASRRVLLRGEPVELTPREFDLLAFLASSPGQTYTREQLLRHVWRSSAQWQDKATVTQHVHRLRHKLEDDPARPRWLQTVSRAGYRFDLTQQRVRSA